MTWDRFATLAVVAWLTACGGGGTGAAAGAPTGAVAPRPQRRDPSVILQEEIDSISSAQTLYDVVRALRPAWLRQQQPTAVMGQNAAMLVVYLDGSRFGDPQSLRQIAARSVGAARYYSPTEAQARFGPGHLAGAIEVTSRR